MLTFNNKNELNITWTNLFILLIETIYNLIDQTKTFIIFLFNIDNYLLDTSGTNINKVSQE